MPAAVKTRPPTIEHELDPQSPRRERRARARTRRTYSVALAGTAAVVATVLGVTYGVTHWGEVVHTSPRADGATGVDGADGPRGVTGTPGSTGISAVSATSAPTSAVTATSSAAPVTKPSSTLNTDTTSAGSGRPAGLMAYMNEDPGHKPGSSEAVQLAKTFSVIVALPGQLGSNIPAMKRANPSLQVLGYLNGSYAQSNEGSRYPSSWYAKTASGSKIRSVGYGNYLMRPDNAGWQAERAATCKKIIGSGLDGCMLDMVGPAPILDGYNTGKPANGSKTFTITQWLGLTGSLGKAVQAANPSHPVWGNGYSSARRYYASDGPSSVLSTKFDRLLSETWIRTSTESLTPRPDESTWRKAVDQVAELESRGLGTSAMVKIWNSGTTSAKNRVAEWAMSSFMLAAGTHSSIGISYGRGEDWTTLQPVEKFSIGSPAGSRTRASNGLWKRPFSNGVVLVNPTASSIKVSLGRSYVGVDGATMTSVTLAPNTGRILRNA